MAQIARPTDTPTEPDTLPAELPDDFGQELIAEFERRTAEQDPAAEGGVGGAVDETEPTGEPDPTDLAAEDAHVRTEEERQAERDTTDDRIFVAEGEEETDEDFSPAPESTESTEAADTADAEPAVDEPVSGYTWIEGDERVDFTDSQVREALNLSAWAQNLPTETREQFVAIERGESVAIPRGEYERFNAWQSSQSSRAQSVSDDDPYGLGDYTDPEIRALKAEVEALKASRNPTAQTHQATPAATPLAGAAPAQHAQNTFNADADATVAAMKEATAAYAETHGLTGDQVDDLLTDAIGLNIIPTIADTLTTYNPVTGGILSYGDPRQVITQALDVALVRNPDLFSAVNARPAENLQDLPPQTEPSTPDPDHAADVALARKKARAGSVSTAPASTTPPSNQSVTSMTPSEITDAMVKDLAAVMGGA